MCPRFSGVPQLMSVSGENRFFVIFDWAFCLLTTLRSIQIFHIKQGAHRGKEFALESSTVISEENNTDSAGHR